LEISQPIREFAHRWAQIITTPRKIDQPQQAQPLQPHDVNPILGLRPWICHGVETPLIKHLGKIMTSFQMYNHFKTAGQRESIENDGRRPQAPLLGMPPTPSSL
jgi:hypothetical protein